MCNPPSLEATRAALPCFTRAEVARRPDLVIVGDAVYDAATFRWAHPGGAVFVSLFGGRDATLAFQSYHMRAFPAARMAKYVKGRLASADAPVAPDAAHLRLCDALRPALSGPRGSFAPRGQLAKAAALVAAAVVLEARMLARGRTVAGSVALGLLFALIGLNVQHDANHGAMFRRGTWNAVAGLAQSWIGGSQLMWLQEHVVLHHLHTGDAAMDCDAQLAPVLRGHAASPWRPWMRGQAAYFLVAEALYGVVPVFMAFAETLYGAHKFDARYRVSPLARPWALQSALFHLLFYARFLYAPRGRRVLRAARAGKRGGSGPRGEDRTVATASGVRFSPRPEGGGGAERRGPRRPPRRSRLLAARAAPGPLAAALAAELAKVACTVLVGGGYLAFFFFLSHNFEGVRFADGADATGAASYAPGSSFLLQQAAASSNVGGPALCALNGGLNYQIEHHLFPRVAHAHYPKIAPAVRAFVEAQGGAYVHFDTVGANLASVARHLAALGDPDFPAKPAKRD